MTADRRVHGSTCAWRKLRGEIAAMLPLPCSVCQLPVLPGSDWHLDHIVPRSRGGTEVWPAHAKCNPQAGARRRSTVVYLDPDLEQM